MTVTLKWKSILLGCCVGALATFAGVHAVDAARHINRLPAPSSTAKAHPLKQVTINPSWIKSGTPKFHVAWYSQMPKTGTGIWQCEGPSTFEWTFSVDEQVYILEGEVHIEYLGKQFSLKPGETAQFLAGTKAVWHVPVSVKKSFIIHRPNMAARLYRRVFGLV